MSEQAAARIHVYAAAMDIEPPELEFEDGELLLTMELVEFCFAEGISFDWLHSGKVSP
jgi:hypothetical protein